MDGIFEIQLRTLYSVNRMIIFPRNLVFSGCLERMQTDVMMTNIPVKIWDRFEAVIENNKVYSDPYRDLTLVSEFRRPNGEKVVFWGFYDGGTTWRIRFMPDQIGHWTYRAAFSDGSKQVSGSFECVESDIPGILSVHPKNRHWFIHRSGKPLLVRSFHVGDCFFSTNLSDEKRDAFLDWAQAQGYNTLSIASHYLNRSEPGRGQGWDTPRLWPLNAQEYQRAEIILDNLANRRIIVFPFAGFFGRGSNYPTDPMEQEQYIRYVLARFGAYWNLLFNVAGPEPLLNHKPYMSKGEVNRLGKLIRQLDVFHHPLTVHNQTGDDEFFDQEWLDFTTLQGPKTTNVEVLHEGLVRNRHAERPLYAQETLWSGNKYHPNYSDNQLRVNALVIHFSGGFFNFIDNGKPQPDSLGDSSAGFSGSLNLSECCQWRHDIIRNVWDFVESEITPDLHPNEDSANSGYCLADIGKKYLVYLPFGGEVQLNLPEGKYQGVWINATDFSNVSDLFFCQSGEVLSSPERGADCILKLLRVV